MNSTSADDLRVGPRANTAVRSHVVAARVLTAVALVAAASFAGIAGAADAPPTVAAGPVTLTFGGFTALEGVYRSKNQAADIGSNFNTGIPFDYQANAHLSEFRMSARQSRFSLLAQGPQTGAYRAEGYLETDFLSSGVSSNSSESNSYTLRVRHFYGVLRNTESAWYMLAGQDWSYATLSTSGTMQPRTEQIPLTIDAQYVVGFNWTRNAQLRLVKLLGDKASVGISFESPQAAFTPGPSTANSCTSSGAVTGSPGGSLLNSTTCYSLDFAPDVIAKFAVNPGFGHFELYGMGRGFRDRYEPTAGSVAGSNNTTWGGGIGAGLIIPMASAPFYFQASGLVGDGIGRYGSGQLPDATIRSDGTVSTIPAAQVLLGLVAKPTPTLQIYLYGGEEQARSRAFTNAAGTKQFGYGNPAYDNSGCDLVTGSSATCVGNTKRLEQVTLGDWWKFYQGKAGMMEIGASYSYLHRNAFAGTAGAPSTNDNIVMLSFRYYPFQPVPASYLRP